MKTLYAIQQKKRKPFPKKKKKFHEKSEKRDCQWSGINESDTVLYIM